jgi:hypothetical protein
MPLKAGEMRQDETGKIHFRQSLIEEDEQEQFKISFFGKDVTIQVRLPLPDTDSKKLSRFLAKAGIETLYLKMNTIALHPDFDFVRNYARFGSRHEFVPFLWCNQPQQTVDLLICTMDSKNQGRFYFGTVFLPGIVYLVPLNRTEEDYGINTLKDSLQFAGNSLNLCRDECFIKRKPIELRCITS